MASNKLARLDSIASSSLSRRELAALAKLNRGTDLEVAEHEIRVDGRTQKVGAIIRANTAGSAVALDAEMTLRRRGMAAAEDSAADLDSVAYRMQQLRLTNDAALYRAADVMCRGIN